MQEIKFVKNGFIFYFRNFKLNKENDLIMEYKIIEVFENNCNDGYYYNAKFVRKCAIEFAPIYINVKISSEVVLFGNVLKEILEIYSKIK